MVLVMGTLVTGADIMQSSKELPVSMERNDYGKGKKTQELKYRKYLRESYAGWMG